MDRMGAIVVFCRAVETGSFSAAARQLGSSKSAVSKHMAALEQRLGAQLLHRTTRKLSLTEAGRGFYERCVRIVRDVEEAEREASQERGAAKGVLPVNAPVSFGQLALAPLLPLFLVRQPELRIDLVLDDRRVDVIEGSFDATIRVASRLPDSSLVARRIAPTRVIVCGAPGYLARRGVPVQPDELKAHHCLLYAYRQQWRFRGERAIAVTGPLLANNGDALREAAIAGLGLVQLPDFIVADALASGALRAVLQPFEEEGAAMWALCSPTRHRSRKARAFVDFLCERFGTGRSHAAPERAG